MIKQHADRRASSSSPGLFSITIVTNGINNEANTDKDTPPAINRPIHLIAIHYNLQDQWDKVGYEAHQSDYVWSIYKL